jgi:hypothetical protein
VCLLQCSLFICELCEGALKQKRFHTTVKLPLRRAETYGVWGSLYLFFTLLHCCMTSAVHDIVKCERRGFTPILQQVNGMSVLDFWVVTPCGLVDRYQHFGGIYCLHLPP